MANKKQIGGRIIVLSGSKRMILCPDGKYPHENYAPHAALGLVVNRAQFELMENFSPKLRIIAERAIAANAHRYLADPKFPARKRKIVGEAVARYPKEPPVNITNVKIAA